MATDMTTIDQRPHLTAARMEIAKKQGEGDQKKYINWLEYQLHYYVLKEAADLAAGKGRTPGF